MTYSHWLVAVVISAVIFIAPAYAEKPSKPISTAVVGAEHSFIPKEQWDKLSSEEKDKIKAERRAKWQAMSPEEKEKRRVEMKERYKNASPEEKERIRERMQARHARMEKEWEHMSPEKRETFAKEHPGFSDRMQHRHTTMEGLKPAAGRDGQQQAK